MQNYLISAIFRKLPLKLLLILLAVFGLFFAFTKADLLGAVGEQTQYGTHTFVNNDGEFICVRATHSNCTINPAPSNGDSTMYGNALYCFDGTFTITCNNQYSYWESFTIPKFTSQQCQTEYNLIPISEVDSSYCQSNNLCPSGGTPSDCPNVGVSNLFINDIFHPGAFNIIMNIPEEIDWDYSYTNSGANFNLDVVGYNQDTEYINSLVDINSYTPTSEDFTNTFLLFKDYGGLLLACLFVILVFYFVKKSFK